MTKEKEKTFTEMVVEYALRNKAEHQQYMSKLPPERLSAVIGRKGKLIVHGEQGGEFIIRVTRYGVFSDTSSDNIRNKIWMTDDTFEQIVTGKLDPKVARARDQLKFSGDRSLYDAAEIMKVFDQWMNSRLKPIARKILRAMG